MNFHSPAARGTSRVIRSILKHAGPSRTLATTVHPTSSEPTPRPESNSNASPSNTHYKITLLRSPISLGSKVKGTLVSLGIHRRMQTVYHPHLPEFAGKILAVKELLAVENVPAEAVMTKTEQRQGRKASRGFVVLSEMKDRGFDVSGRRKARPK